METPLESKYILTETEFGKGGRIPALDQRWKSDIRFINYSAPPLSADDRASTEEWLERAGFLEDDLDTLLRMPHEKFWCQVVFDDSLQACIDSYLKFAPRPHDIMYKLTGQVKEKQDKLHRLFFFTCLRMGTHKESKQNFITPSVFGDILYENFIFDVPKILDLCALYCENNGPLLAKLIANIFTQQPKYLNDLTETVPTIIHSLINVLKECDLSVGSTSGSPLKLSPSGKNSNKLVTMTTVEFYDVIMYVYDIAMTLRSFLEMYPPAAKVLLSQEFPIRLVTFYETIVPAISEAFKSREWPDPRKKAQLKHSWRKAQVAIAHVFRQIALQNCLDPLLEATTEEEATECTETYLYLNTAILGERRFLAVYEKLFPFTDDRDLISQSKCSIDETRLQFIRDGINEAVALYGKQPPRAESPVEEEARAATPPQHNFLSEAELMAASRDSYIADAGDEGACAPRITGIELESLITSVKDLLPNLGEGFIELCLEELNYNVENVINAVLEDKLPASLSDMDRSLKRDKSKIKPEEPALIEQRASVYDNDEFDFFRRDDVDMSRMHKGKKTKVSAKDLDDKEHIKALKPLYEKYGHEFTESAYDNNRDYDDEYDDTYDTNLVGADDADSADELSNRRLFLFPRVLGNRDSPRDSPRLTEHTDESESEEEKSRRRDQFVENPADVRARREARQAYNARNKGPPPKHDVKGREKGHGQEKDVLRNRAQKERNKNKHRRNLADKKRQQ